MGEKQLLIDLSKLTDGERIEMKKLGILSDDNKFIESVYPSVHIHVLQLKNMLCMLHR